MGSAFESIVGSAWVRRSSAPSLDGVPIEAVVTPASAEEVAECLRLATRDGTAVVARGGGSKLGWGNRGRAKSFTLLDLSRLSGEPDVQADEGVVSVGAGVPVARLARQLAGLDLAVRLPDQYPGATVGGSVAADPPAPDRSLDRSLRNDLLGVEVALAQGSLARAGGRVVKNVTGYDLVRLYCGSLGTLGIVTRVVLRVRPRPEQRWVLARTLHSAEAARPLLVELRERGVAPEAALLCPSPGGAGLRLLWVLEGIEPDVIERSERVEGDRVDASTFRDRASSLVAPPEAGGVSLRLGTRPGDLIDLWRAVEEWGVAPVALPLSGVVRVRGPVEGLDRILARAAEAGWACVIETCPAEEKLERDVFGAALQGLGLLRAVKQRFDPAGILAPGRLVGGI